MAPEWTLGDRIRRARRHAGMDRLELAEKLGVSRASVGLWENDEHRPKNVLETLEKIAEATGVDRDWLYGVRTGSRCLAPAIPGVVMGLKPCENFGRAVAQAAPDSYGWGALPQASPVVEGLETDLQPVGGFLGGQ